MSDIFISYNSKDKAKAKLFATLLEQHGWSVFWDKNIPPGKTFDEYIGQQLDAAKCIIVLWSKTSVSSDWVKEEAQRGAARKVLVPIFIEQVSPPLGFGRIEAAELFDWDGDVAEVEFQNLLNAIALHIPEDKLAQTSSLPPAKPESKIAKKPDKESMSSSQHTLPRLTKTHMISGLAGLILLVALAAVWQVTRPKIVMDKQVIPDDVKKQLVYIQFQGSAKREFIDELRKSLENASFNAPAAERKVGNYKSEVRFFPTSDGDKTKKDKDDAERLAKSVESFFESKGCQLKLSVTPINLSTGKQSPLEVWLADEDSCIR